MAFARSSPSANAVIHAILALSALHGDGSSLCSRDPGQASLLKTTALRALATSVSQDLDSDDAARHVVCGMLLCAYEVSFPFLVNRYSMLMARTDTKRHGQVRLLALVHLWRKEPYQTAEAGCARPQL